MTLDDKAIIDILTTELSFDFVDIVMKDIRFFVPYDSC